MRLRQLPYSASLPTSILTISVLCHQAYAACECGYSVNATTDPKHAVFTDLFETDFLHLQTLKEDPDWVPQTYLTPAPNPQSYGKNASEEQFKTNPTPGRYCYKGPGRNGPDPGLQLYVKSGTPAGGTVPMAELVTKRTDMLYGSFRAALKYTSINGTCGAFFFYRDDAAEIDFELLSSQINPSSPTQPLFLVIHYGGAGSNFQVFPLPFNPSTAYHEYRFDWQPNSVAFYADSKFLVELTTGAPSSPGGLRLMHWSTGDPNWSRGPPQQDAVMTVSYVKAYFNSSDPARSDVAYKKRCHHPQWKATICRIPDLRPGTLPDPNTDAGETFFFTAQKNMARGQLGYQLPWYADGGQGEQTARRTGVVSRVKRGVLGLGPRAAVAAAAPEVKKVC